LLRERAIERRMNRGLRVTSFERKRAEQGLRQVSLAPWKQAI